MENLSLTLSAEADLTVKSFTVREKLSALFDIEILATSPADNLPFEAIVGRKATFEAVSPWGEGAPRKWTGVVHRIEQIDAEPSGLTTYSIHVAPAMWRLTRRTNCRIFQHMSIPEIAIALLAEYEIAPVLRLDPAAFARHEYRVQYGETDLAFLSRLLEEAGIAFMFEEPPPPEKKDGTPVEEPFTLVVLAEDATRRDPRATSPEYWNTKDLPNDREALCQVRSAREVRSGKATIRDYDFRTRPRHKLLASATIAPGSAEDRMEVYEYQPGAFVIEPANGDARVDEREAQARVDKALASRRGGRNAITYRANVIDLPPGVVFSMHGHPNPDLGDKRALLAVALTIEGTRAGEWTVNGEATFGDEAHRPLLLTPKPKIAGVQSAFVVGPAGEEIHTDAMGRVRVEFHWDREGKSDEKSSCFLRVSQAWAGPGYGIVAVPRIGEEVLVSFFDGDPDQPVVTGRVHNGTAPPPQALPANKTKTIWRTMSTPGGGGYSEIALDDRKGEEIIAIRAERDYERTILREERVTIGSSLTTNVGASEVHEVKADQTLVVGGSRETSVHGVDTLHVGESLHIDLGGAAGGTFTKDGKIVLSTGEASLVLDGPNLYIDAKAIVSVRSGDTLALSGGDVAIDGQPNVKLNSAQASPPSVSLPSGQIMNYVHKLLPGAPPLNQLAQLIQSPPIDPGLAPGELSIPPEIEDQLQSARNKVMAGVDQLKQKIENAVDQIGQDVLPEVESAMTWAEAKVEEARVWAEKTKAKIAAEIDKYKAQLIQLKTQIENAVAEVRDKIQAKIKEVQDRIQALRDRGRALLQKVKDEIKSYKDMIMAKWEELRALAIEFRNKVVGPFEEIRANIKSLVQNVKDTVQEFKDTVTGIVNDVKNTINEVKTKIQEIKADIKDWFGLKSAFNEAKQEVKDAVDGAKQAWNEAKQEVKDTIDEAKGAIQDAKDAWNDIFHSGSKAPADPTAAFKPPAGNVPGSGFKAPANGLNIPGSGAKGGQLPNLHMPGSAAKGATEHAQIPGGLHFGDKAAEEGASLASHRPGGIGPIGQHSMKQIGGEQGGFDLQKVVSDADGAAHQHASSGAGAAQAMAAHGSGAMPSMPNMPNDVMLQNPLHGSTVVTRAGGFTPDTFVDAINSSQTPTLLQSPNEGQLLVLRTANAAPLDQTAFTNAFVDGQMDGLTSSDAFTQALMDKGYIVYERPWDSWLTTLLKKAVL
ncbi:MAG: type VI secretion system tip protein TssI/VgrG [Polyangiaceae bacterium]